METAKPSKQTALRILFGLGVIALVFLVEVFGLHPTGIYSYSSTGYKDFEIGMSRDEVLDSINLNRSIRTIRACFPEEVFHLTDRQFFELSLSLLESDYWICYDRRGSDYLFVFNGGVLERILIQRLRLFNDGPLPLFEHCENSRLSDIDSYLSEQDRLKVFFKD